VQGADYSLGANPDNISYCTGVGYNAQRFNFIVDALVTGQQPDVIVGHISYGQGNEGNEMSRGMNSWVQQWVLNFGPAKKMLPNWFDWPVNRPPTASGLMIRESLAQACGRYLLIQVEASGDLVCRWRDKTGDQDDNQRQALGKVALPVHLRLVQTGREIRVFASADGQNWGAPRMSHTASLDKNSRIGLFVCSGNTFSSTTATYDSVTVSK
jgi:hypothetical protein